MLLVNVDNREANHGRCNPCSNGEDLIKTLEVVQMNGWTQNVRQGSQQFVNVKKSWQKRFWIFYLQPTFFQCFSEINLIEKSNNSRTIIYMKSSDISGNKPVTKIRQSLHVLHYRAHMLCMSTEKRGQKITIDYGVKGRISKRSHCVELNLRTTQPNAVQRRTVHPSCPDKWCEGVTIWWLFFFALKVRFHCGGFIMF